MTLDVNLVKAIKATFAKVPSDDLQQMLKQHDGSQWSDEAFAAAKEVLEYRARPDHLLSVSSLVCPQCESVMQRGKVSIEMPPSGTVSAVLGAMISGSSMPPQHYIYFRQDGGSGATCIEPSREAYYCPNCEALLVAGCHWRLVGQ
jgi:hypothetical protein